MKRIPAVAASVLAVALIAPSTWAADALDRTILSIAEPKVAPITVLDAREAKAPPRFEVKAPESAPNVGIVLIDDIGKIVKVTVEQK